jgi:hypothetical protein
VCDLKNEIKIKIVKKIEKYGRRGSGSSVRVKWRKEGNFRKRKEKKKEGVRRVNLVREKRG